MNYKILIQGGGSPGEYISEISCIPSGGLAGCTIQYSSFVYLHNVGAYGCYSASMPGFNVNSQHKIYDIGSHAFENCNLSQASFRCTEINQYTFYKCTSLQTVSIFGNCSLISSYAFSECTALQTFTLENPSLLSKINAYAFCECSNLSTVLPFSYITSIGTAAFEYCASITSVSFPTLITIAPYCFYSCTRISSIISTNFTNCLYINGYAFGLCYNLSTVSMYSVSQIESYAFYNCSSLKTVRVSRCLYIGSSAFYSCSQLSSIYINTNVSSQICTLANSNAFAGTLITSTTGRIVVPNALRASYKAAANWAYFSNRIYSS